MHAMGTHAKLVLVKANGVRQVLFDGPYKGVEAYKYIVGFDVDKLPTIEVGDNFEHYCTFNTSMAHNWTFYGNHHEMCMFFMSISPFNPLAFDLLVSETVDSCDAYTGIIDNCDGQNIAPYITQVFLKNGGLMGKNVFMEYCGSNRYPETECSTKCYDFLASIDFLNNHALQREMEI